MPAYAIEDFKQGLDLRKTYVTAPAGTLRTLRNCFISAGAEIEKRTAFILWGPAPPGSMGVVSRNGEIFVIEGGASGITDWSGAAPNGHPGVISLPLPGVGGTWRLASWQLFNGQFYIVMANSNGSYYHFYNQVQVTDAMATSSCVRTYGAKMYGVDGRLLRFSAINDPTKWTPPPTGTTNDGSGYIDLSAQDSDSTSLIGLEVYYNRVAIFSNLSTQFWTLDPDPSQNQFVQLLRSTGLIAANGLTQYGNGDVIYLSAHGVRSLRVQNLSLTAGVTDVGTPIDETFRQLIVANGQSWFAQARCLIQPRSGRLFVVLPNQIFVLSTFQEPPITAWSSFDAPFNFVDSCVADPWVVLRGDDNNLYLYGSDVSFSYDATEAEVITPALNLGNPSEWKRFHSFDVGAEGTWTLSVGCDPNNQATEEQVATFTGSTYMEPQMTMPETSTHISLRFRSTDAERCRLGHVMIMFDKGAET